MGKLSKVLVVLAVAIGLAGTASARTNVTIDLDAVTPEQAAQILKAKNQVVDKVKDVKKTVDKVVDKTPKIVEDVKAAVQSIDGSKIKTWSLAIAEGIKTVCTTLSIEANEFVKTPVGMGVAGLLAWKIAGDEIAVFVEWIKDLVIATLGYTFFIIVLGWNYKRKRGFYVDKNKKTGDVTRTAKYNWPPKEANDSTSPETDSTIVHTVLFMLANIVYMIIVL